MYYTVNKTMEIIKYYHVNIDNLKEIHQEMASVGVAQYGIESSMPRASTISNVVQSEALRRVEDTKMWAGMITDIKYLQDRWCRITDERESRVLSLRLDGLSMLEIANIEGMERSGVYRILIRVCKKLSTG